MTEKKKTADGKNKKVESAENKPRAIASGIKVWCRNDELKDITELIENPRNPNKHPDKQIALLAKIIRHQGWRQPITISKRSGFIVKGHGRLQAAKVLNVELVPVEYQDYETEAAEYADLLADNRLAELAEPDADMIDDLLNDEMFENFDLDLAGFDSGALADLLKDLDVINDSCPDENTENKNEDLADTAFTFGQYKFTVERNTYLLWQESIRQKVGFDNTAANNEIRTRLGI